MQKTSKAKAFSFVEIIITISIISLLAIIGISSKKRYDENVNNSKIVSDIETINNALTSFSQEVKSLPMPGGNINFYSADTSYKHSFEDADTFGVYGSLTETTIPKKYLDILPLDPRTNSYYAYGKTKKTNEFEVASVQYIDAQPITKVIGNYTAETGPYNLIREYNGPNFVYDRSNANFPYNPDELVLIASVKESGEWKNYREGDIISTGAGEEKEIFFSDGSVSILEENSQITLNKLNFKGKDNLNSFVKIALGAGTIWTRATKLNDESSFEVYTSDTNATVRGTIFKVTLTDITVIEGEVDIYKTTTAPQLVEEINVQKGEVPQIYTINTDSLSPGTGIEIPDFTKSTDPRDPETVANVLKDAEALKDELAKNDDIQIDVDCSTFKIDGKCMDAENNLEGYNLIAYAPYDKVGDLYLYGSGGKIDTKTNYISGAPYVKIDGTTSNTSGDDLSSFGNVLSKESSLVEASSGEKGIVISSTGSADYLRYDINNLLSNLSQERDFAIEINVKIPNNLSSGSRYLFELGSYKLFFDYQLRLFLKNGNGSFANYTIPKGNFLKIIAIKDGTNYSLLINGINYGFIIDGKNQSSFSSIYPLGTNLYIGGKSDLTSQINDIIDYVKIYKK